MEKEIEELQKYALLEGTELGEAFGNLIAIHNYGSYLSNVFIKSVEKEVNYWAHSTQLGFRVEPDLSWIC